METIENQVFDAERALYASRGISLINCAFDGPADGESALKESADICLSHCFCNLRYPFWHDRGLMIEDSEMTPLCRAALWYSDQIEIVRTKLYGIKALRECSRVTMRDCDIRSPEFGWSVRGIEMERCNAESEYFMMRAQNLIFPDVCLKGKYSFQYIQDARLDRCTLDTKDALWHAKHVTVQNSVIRGEYLAWYCEDVTFKNCKISGTQPFCYCKGLKLIDCELTEADLCFEKSDVEATLTAPVISIKNPRSGCICAPSVGEIIRDDPDACGEIVTGVKLSCLTKHPAQDCRKETL